MTSTPAKGRPEVRRRALALALGALGAAIAYVIACIYDRAVSGLTDPFLIVRDAHFGYYHRAVLAGWLGGVVALAALRTLDTPERVRAATSHLERAALPLVALLAAATYFFP